MATYLPSSGGYSTNNEYIKYRIVITEGTLSGRTKPITVSVQFYRTNDYETTRTGTVYCSINGSDYSQSFTTSSPITYYSYTELFSKTVNITYGSDGTATVPIYAHWSTQGTSSGGGAYSSSSQGGNVSLTDISPVTYTVSYNANGGSGAPSSQTKYYGTNLTLSSTKPTRSGYTFMGWGTSASDTSADYSAGGSYTTNAAITLYAVWKKTITLTYNANGGTGAPSSQSATVYNATTSYKFTLSSTKPTRTGYTFLGWSTSSSATSASYFAGGSITLSSSDTLYAVWEEHKLTVNYYSNYATYGTYQGTELSVSSSTNIKIADATGTFYYDNSYSSGLVNVQNTSYLYLARMGYTPNGYWGTSTTNSNLVHQNTAYTGQSLAQALDKTLVSGNTSVDLYPQWEINTYTFLCNANADAATGIMDSVTVEWGETFILPENTFKREGYKFVGWNAYRNADNTWYVTGQGWITEDAILEGGYEKKLYQNQEEHVFGNSWVKGDEYTISDYTMYAVWEISGVVYIDNGTTFEPYLAYIDNGTDWDLYLSYIDDGMDWNIIS